MPILTYILTVLGAYLLGSIPSGFLMARAKGIDIRAVGSGNIGATNAMRVLGKPAGITVLMLDALKGYLAVALAVVLFQHLQAAGSADIVRVLAGIGAVLGHNYTCWLKFKGGKGIATTAGVYLALAPWALLAALAVFLLAVFTTRYVSVGSVLGAIVLPAVVWFLYPHDIFLGVVTTLLGALAIYKHKANLQRLRAGTENRLGQKQEAK